MDYYRVLKLERGASEADIKSAFRRLSKLYHPDVTTVDCEYFIAIVEAYRVLGDPQKRKEYDNLFTNQENTPVYAMRVNDVMYVEHKCTVADLLSNKIVSLVTLRGETLTFQYPGFYTPQHAFKTRTGMVFVTFQVTDYTVDGYRLVPDLEGVCATIVNKNVRVERGENGYMVETPYGMQKLKLTSTDNKIMIFLDGGIAFEQPVTGKIMKSLLLIDEDLVIYNSKSADQRTKRSDMEPGPH